MKHTALWLGTLMGISALWGCGSSDSKSTGAPSEAGAPSAPQTVAPSSETESVLAATSGYSAWAMFPENTAPTLSKAHMGMYVVAHYNDVVATAVQAKTLPLPDGALIVKDNFAHADDKMPMAITVMSKQSGGWYWIEATSDGKVILDSMGKALEGTDVAMCVGCHESKKSNDYVMTHDFTK